MFSHRHVLFACLGLVAHTAVHASPADYVYTPTVEYGEKEVDVKYGSSRQKDGTLLEAASVGFGYGAKENWFTEFYLKQERSGNQVANIAEWENKFQLTETGKYPFDLGFITEVEAPLNGQSPWELKVGPLLQTEIGKLQLNGNVLFEHPFGRDEDGAAYATNLLYQWQAKYRWLPEFEYGVQGLGEVGKWNNWDSRENQLHSMGPAVFGKLALGNRQFVRYNAAWLFGSSTAAANHTLRMQVEFEY